MIRRVQTRLSLIENNFAVIPNPNFINRVNANKSPPQSLNALLKSLNSRIFQTLKYKKTSRTNQMPTPNPTLNFFSRYWRQHSMLNIQFFSRYFHVTNMAAGSSRAKLSTFSNSKGPSVEPQTCSPVLTSIPRSKLAQVCSVNSTSLTK